MKKDNLDIAAIFVVSTLVLTAFGKGNPVDGLKNVATGTSYIGGYFLHQSGLLVRKKYSEPVKGNQAPLNLNSPK